MTPIPKFHVENATHIRVQWDKPFSLPEFDVRNYTLTVLNTSSKDANPSRETFNAQDTDYPVIHYINNHGVIPQDCIYLNFTLTATNDAGTSTGGLATGGFGIGNI